MVEYGIDIGNAVASGELVVNGKSEQFVFPEHSFTTADRLITVDAPDGSGKGAIALILQQQLALIYGENQVCLVSPNKFNQSPEAQEMGKKLKSRPGLSPRSVRHNSHFMASLMLNYQKVILPALESEKIVIVDSSEIRSLAYMLDRGSPDSVQSTLRWIKSGRATSNILAENRVVIKVCPEDCLANIGARSKKDYGDPTDPTEAQRRDDCYSLAIQVVKKLKQNRPSNWIIIDNPRIESGDINAHLDQLVTNAIVPQLRF